MKTPLLFLSIFLFALSANPQIISPSVNAYFGVDADLKARYLKANLQASDDWYLNPGTIGTSANGTFVIDTTGAAAVVAAYNSDVSPWPKRMSSFYRTMSRPAFSIVNNRLWLDALFVRDYHGNDTTVFVAGSDKNGMSPASWSGGVQGIPDKNDILDMFMHVRRAGPNATDPLWFFGGVSLDNVTGNRYFDFEMYQTDIYYDRPSGKWYGYGPDAGHTSWQFDAAGNVIKPGDIIFSAEYQSSSLTSIEARIWVDQAALSITPVQFNWSGKFDGAGSGSQYGYASIVPKTAGDFYTGLQSGNGEWAGPFSLVKQDNSLGTTYIARQFMEFSVNLTKLGLDPVSIFGSDICGTPFNRMVVKTRASASFTAELKDFVAPTDLFLSPRVNALADVPLFCGNLNNVSTLQVTNPSGSSVYTWTTPDGHIIDDPENLSVRADSAGTYIVTQQLMAGCGAYARDTVQIIYDAGCTVLDESKIDFGVNLEDNLPLINWVSKANNQVSYYEVQRSYNGKEFETIKQVKNSSPETAVVSYAYTDKDAVNGGNIYYRLKVTEPNGTLYTSTIKVKVNGVSKLRLLPNPAKQFVHLSIATGQKEEANVTIYNLSGALVYKQRHILKAGQNNITIDNVAHWVPGMYVVNLTTGAGNHWDKLIVTK
jgi:hypothetical protein